MDDRIYFRQLLAGRDFARDDPVAGQMVNFVYFIGDRESGEAVVVDPAYRVAQLVDLLQADGMRLTGVLATHFHPDHIGGDMMGLSIEGVRELLDIAGVKVHIHRDEAPWVKIVTGVSDSDLSLHEGGDTMHVGRIPVTFLHTPGHTPGSQCFLVDGRLVSGDTLFLDGCGRTDLPGADPSAMYESLTSTLAKVSDEAVLYPGHLYSPEPSATMGDTRKRNFVFRLKTLDQWLTMFDPAR